MEAKIKHLEFIQAIITRMGQNSFMVKGWCVTLISAIYALASKDASRDYILVTYVAIPSFWILDGFYIAVERRYRCLFSEVAQRAVTETDFDLDASRFSSSNGTWLAGVFSKTLLVFYPFIMAVALIVMFLITPPPSKATAKKTDACNGSKVICRVIATSRSSSPNNHNSP